MRPTSSPQIWQIKRRKLHHEKLQHMKAVEPLGKIMMSRCCLIRSFKNTSLSYRIHCYYARSSCSLLSKRQKKHEGFIYCRLRCGLKRMRTSVCSFISPALSVPVSKKTMCKRSLSVPRFSENHAIFYPFPYKTCAYKRSNFVGTGTHFYPSRSASFDV